MENIALDLWPTDIAVATLITPKAILQQQASLLGQKTGNLVEAEVVTSSGNNMITHSVFLVAPALGQYRYLLLRVIHPIDFYPLTISFEPMNHSTTATSQEVFIEELGKILSSEKTKAIIQALVAQSQN